MRKSITCIKKSDYSPVIIPTLNRYTHFVRCLESIERCTGAELTDVYVGLDYPPSEKYVEGWKKIDDYLRGKEANNNFRNLFVRRRATNCGLDGDESNFQLLIQEIASVGYDTYIGTEDDNEFSPNFLEYMNQALGLYANEPQVISISAYTPPLFQELVNHTTFFGIDAPAYGIGVWLKKTPEINQVDLAEYLRKIPLRKFIGYVLTYPALISMGITMIDKKVLWGDVSISLNNLLFGTFTLQPTYSLARNWGADGSGARSGIVEGLEKEAIQTAWHFDLERIPFEYPEKLKRLCRYRNMPAQKTKFARAFLGIVVRSLRFYFGK